MNIENMFQKDINRKINGVVMVKQDTEDILVQELDEYVVTDDLRKHIDAFFKAYEESFRAPTSDIGVWISGFFGSGKSHFLKILSYLLENREIQGVCTVERFRKKLEEYPKIYKKIEKATRGHTDTILFNIDIEGTKKDQMAILRVFRKMFYNYLGYYGEIPKVARLEKFLDQKGKLEEFRRVAEEKIGSSWTDICDNFELNEEIVEVMQEVLGRSKEWAEKWFDSEDEEETSIAYFVSQLKAYVDTKPDDFRLLFMMDEVGQYIGENNDYLLNLQSMVEEIGSKCQGKVWVVCTGQEALDEIIKTRQDAFSKIQARFGTRLSLTSTSADEVIQKRILQKTPEAEETLKNLYCTNESVLRNLFSFDEGTILDIKGYRNSEEFIATYPFIPYQFTILQKVFTQIRKHGNSGKNLSGGERSMLSGFQEAAQKIEKRDENTLAPFYLFYDTVHSFLDSSIRVVIERAQKAADRKEGLKPVDVDILKLLYLIRYVDDIPSTMENLVILMADDIRVDKIKLRKTVCSGLERLKSQNYIGQNGETYQFLTDEEQDIQREINDTTVKPTEIVSRIKDILYGDIYDTLKCRRGRADFSFDRYVDDQSIGTTGNEMKLVVYTDMSDAGIKGSVRLAEESKPAGVVVVLADGSYAADLEVACKIRTYMNKKIRTQMTDSVRMILNGHEAEANLREKKAREELIRVIREASYYVDGEKVSFKADIPKGMLDKAMECLADRVYGKLNYISVYAENDGDIRSILHNGLLSDGGKEESNADALNEVENYLRMKEKRVSSVTMSDIQNYFQSSPFGWREIDISALAAFLLYKRKIDIEYGGQKLSAADSIVANILRKNREMERIKVKVHQSVSVGNLRKAREFLREYFGDMNVPDTEEDLVPYILQKFEEEKTDLKKMLERYTGHKYPDRANVAKAKERVESILNNQGDSIALIDKILAQGNELLDLKEILERVKNFFESQVEIFDAAVKLEKDLQENRDVAYLEEKESSAYETLNEIRKIIVNGENESVYREIPKLSGLMEIVREAHERLLSDKREKLSEDISLCVKEIHQAAGGRNEAQKVVQEANEYYTGVREEVKETKFIALLEALSGQLSNKKDQKIQRIKSILKEADHPTSTSENRENSAKPEKKKRIKKYRRMVLFSAEKLETEADVDIYVKNLRKKLLELLKDCDGIEIE